MENMLGNTLGTWGTLIPKKEIVNLIVCLFVFKKKFAIL